MLKKEAWIKELANKMVFGEDADVEAGEETEAADAGEEKDPKETKGPKTKMNLEDMSTAQKVALIKSVIKHCNDKLEDEEFSDFMEKVEAVINDYTDEADDEDEEAEEEEETED